MSNPEVIETPKTLNTEVQSELSLLDKTRQRAGEIVAVGALAATSFALLVGCSDDGGSENIEPANIDVMFDDVSEICGPDGYGLEQYISEVGLGPFKVNSATEGLTPEQYIDNEVIEKTVEDLQSNTNAVALLTVFLDSQFSNLNNTVKISTAEKLFNVLENNEDARAEACAEVIEYFNTEEVVVRGVKSSDFLVVSNNYSRKNLVADDSLDTVIESNQESNPFGISILDENGSVEWIVNPETGKFMIPIDMGNGGKPEEEKDDNKTSAVPELDNKGNVVPVSPELDKAEEDVPAGQNDDTENDGNGGNEGEAGPDDGKENDNGCDGETKLGCEGGEEPGEPEGPDGTTPESPTTTVPTETSNTTPESPTNTVPTETSTPPNEEPKKEPIKCDPVIDVC